MAATQLPANTVGSRIPAAEEIQEYEKILRISEDIFTGTHPRLKVPQQFVRKVASRNPPASVTPRNKADDNAGSPSKPHSQYVAPMVNPVSSQSTDTINGTSSTTASRILPKPTSEINPIFLEKSEDLVRAELQLQRQRVERDIREQVEQKRQESKQKVSIQDATPDFDVSDVLTRAFEMVKPSPARDVPGPGAPSDSFDENSFYSSRAPDSPQHGDHQKPSSASSPIVDEHGTGVIGERYSDELHRLEALNRPGSDQSMQDTYSVADHRTSSHQRQPHRPEGPAAYREQYARQQVDPLDEPEYSPPAPGVAPMERVASYEPPRADLSAQRRRADPRESFARRSISPADGVRVIRNHITSPAAPQPSRVSPLATAKVPSVHQLPDSRPEFDTERRGSPELSAQPLVSRKRRRIHDDRDHSRPPVYRNQGATSVKPFIKEEPVSPPPFADTPPIYRARAPPERPVYIDVSSPGYAPVIERREPPMRASAYGLEPYDEIHGDPGIPRTVSRLGTQRPMRDDQDLRRVASLHQARKPEYAREYLDQQSPHSARNGPYAVVERPPQQDGARYYDDPGAPPPRRYASPIPPQLTEAYYNDYVVEPPPRRIVIDEHGNQYYETLPAPRVQAMPPPASRIPRTDVYEGPPHMRHASVRAASVLEDPYGGRTYVQEMPPQGAYRRVTDYARPTPNERRPYAAPFEAREPYPRSSSVQVHDYTTRQSHYAEEPELPRERIVRIPSVRPPTTRYQEPREVAQRVESAHPGGRDMSVYIDKETRRPREYVERPVYVAAPRPVAREERYYENGDHERMVLDGPRDNNNLWTKEREIKDIPFPFCFFSSSLSFPSCSDAHHILPPDPHRLFPLDSFKGSEIRSALTMHKISNFTGQARHGWERMTPNFGMTRAHAEMATHSLRRPHGAPPMTPPTGIDPTVNLSFNVPFSSNLAGPDADDVLHASPKALQRWSFPEGTPEGTPIYQLPVHTSNVESLRTLCRQITEGSNGRVEALINSSEPKTVPSLQRRPQGLATNVCITGDGETVRKMRAKILNETPILLRCATVDVDAHLITDNQTKEVRPPVLEHLDTLSGYTGTDIFLLTPKLRDTDSAIVSSYGYATDNGLDQRFRVCIYGDMESTEHAKTRVLIMIDQILKRHVDAVKLDLTTHTLVCGRTRKNVKLIEAATGTAIYFPPPFPRIFGYIPPGAHRRSEDEVYITGETQEQITRAKQKLHELVMGVKVYVKDVMVNSNKIDNILLDRLDKVRKVMEMNGSYVLFPQLGSQRGLAGQFYSASWWILVPDPTPGAVQSPSHAEVRTMLSDICTNSGAEVSFDNLNFTINGSDDAVKAAMMVINQIPFVQRSQYQMRVKIELANEHKEFVSGKKNGKINKIMGQSNVQIIFDGFNEYNFYIDVCGNQFESTKSGLDLVEQEMPASISFHVPDQYHKRIIGIGGQHIQRIMKKYSVFVKFSNAMDRGGMGKDDDDIKVDNVICRTPARNAQSLDLVKQEIMDMVEKVDAEYVSERVVINRLYHRELLARMSEIDELEKKWNCKIEFPSTELASDVVTISGPEYQVPQAVDALLGMVPESHELLFQSSPELQEFFRGADFREDVCAKLKDQYEVDTTVDIPEEFTSENGSDSPSSTPEDRVVLGYTRNNAGGLKDAIDFLISRLVAHGLDATTVKGAIPRPKSDSFEESLPFFDSKLLQHAPTPIATDSPTRPSFTDETSERGSIFERLRKPGSISSFSSFIGRKNHSASPASFFKHASSNASKASLVSMESRDSGYRNPWNDSGVNLPEDDLPALGSSHSHSSSNGWPARFDTKFPFGTAPGDMTPKHDLRASFDSGRPSTSNSTSGYPAPIGPPR
ncbi:hypothetical protein BDW62DRAFT_209273 [Aspergillus aurantiobrunneus]